MNWIRRKWTIAKQNKLLWWNLLLVSCTWVVIFGYPAPTGADLRLRIWAMVLQLVGVVTVWADLTGAANAFKRDGIFKRTKSWLRALCGVPVTLSANMTGSFPGLTVSVRASQRIPAKPDATIDERVATLEANAAYMDVEIAGAYSHTDKKTSELQEKINQESQTRTHEHAVLKKSLEDLAVGNYAVLLFGVVWLGAGVCLSSLAPEIVKIVAGDAAAVLTMLTAPK